MIIACLGKTIESLPRSKMCIAYACLFCYMDKSKEQAPVEPPSRYDRMKCKRISDKNFGCTIRICVAYKAACMRRRHSSITTSGSTFVPNSDNQSHKRRNASLTFIALIEPEDTRLFARLSCFSALYLELVSVN